MIDTSDLSTKPADRIERNGAGEVVLRTKRLLALDEHDQNPITGRFVLVENYLPVGGGIVSMEGYPDQRNLITVRSTNITAVGHAVTREARAGRNGHKGAVLWFTGLSGAGKSTLALALERELFAKGYQVYVLDGDNIRTGLNANLGFSPEDRAENIRRVGEVASLFADAGFIVISSFISPYRSDRERARDAAKPESRLGTGHGRRETSHAQYVNFERASTSPAELITLYYDSHRNLVAKGIIRETAPLAPAVAPLYPRPFPGFVPDPGA